MRNCGLKLVCLFALSGPLEAQVLERGDTLVEIIGLNEWTPAQVEDELARYAPGISLASSACAVILRDSIVFDAASRTT